MAKKISFETEVNPAGFRAGLVQVERMSKESNARMTQIANDYNSPSATALRIALTKEATIKRRAMEAEQRAAQDHRKKLDSMVSAPGQNFTTGTAPVGRLGARRVNFAVAGSMFTSVARDSAASLASGAPLTQVIAQQAPQVLQALAMMNAGTKAWVAVIAVAGVIAWHKLTRAIADAAFQVSKFAGRAEWFEQRAENLRKIRVGLEDVDAAERTAAAAQLERDKKARQSAADLLKSERELQKEKLKGQLIMQEQQGQITPEARQRALLEQELAFLKEDLATAEAQGREQSSEALRLQNELRELQRTPEGETEFQQQIRDIRIKSIQDEIALATGQTLPEYQARIAQLQSEIQALQNQIQLTYGEAWKSALEPDKTKTPEQRSFQLPSSDSLVRIGGFMGSTSGRIESLSQRQVDLMQFYLPQIAENTRPRSITTNSWPVT